MMIELGLDDTAFGKGVDGAKKRVSYFSKEMQANMRIADLAGDKYGKLGVKFDGLTNIIGAQQQKLEQLRKSYEGSLVDGKPTEQTAKLATQLQQANGQLAQYNTQLANTAGEMAKWKIENEGVTGGLMTFGKGLETVGGQMTTVGDKMTKGVTLPIVAGVGLVTKAAIDWESAFTGVKKTVDEVVDSNGKVVYSYDDLEASLRGLTKVLPATHEEIAAVAEAAGQLGIETKNVTSFTKTMIDLGESTSMSSEEAATALARLANITGLPQTEFENLGSSIVDLGNNFATTESEITAMAMRLAGAGSIVGMSEADIVGLSAALSSVGIEAESGGSSISKLMINMQLASSKGVDAFNGLQQVAERNGIAWENVSTAFNNGGKELKEMSNALGLGNDGLKELYKNAEDNKQSLEDFAYVAGMTGDEFAQAFEKDAVGAIGKFIEGLSHAEEKGSTAIEMLDDMGISEVRLRDALLRAGGASELFSDAIATSNKAFKENTALSEEAEKRYGTMESQLEMLKSEVRDVAIDLGGPFVDAFREGIKVAKPMLESISKLAKSFADADPKTQKMVMKLIAYTAAAGPVLSITGRIASGIGGMTTKTIGFLGVMAKKKTVADFTAQLLTGSADILKWNSAATAGATATAGFGSAASTAAGTSGVAGLTGALGALGPVALAIVGTTGVLVAGYGAWKLFGEEAWNSSQRVERWGTDVGGVTDRTLVTIRDNLQDAGGQFTLLEQGISENTPVINDNFEKMGKNIEDNLTSKISALKEMLVTLPDDVQAAGEKRTNEEIANQEKYLKMVQENNEKISQIRTNASNNHRQETYEESVIIKALAEETATAYVQSLGKSEKETKEILSAMTGNVDEATSEQAKSWLQSLGQQRQNSKLEYGKMTEDLKTSLVDAGYDLNSSYAKEMLGLLEKSSESATRITEDQMSLILGKYPELVDEVWLANGQLISSMGTAGQDAVANNKSIMESFTDFSTTASKTAEENAKKIDLVADHANQFGEIWNGLVLDPKTGEVKTNAQEEVTKAASSEKGWNELVWASKNADLSSNTKLMIAEAAISNGIWNTMTYTDQQALVESNATNTVMQALQAKGIWENLNFEQQKAILYSDTPEVVAQAISDLGLWEQLSPTIKELGANNYDFLVKLNESKDSLKSFNETNPELKRLIIDGEQKMNAIDARTALEQFNALPEDLKTLVMENRDYMNKLENASSTLTDYNRMNVDLKTLEILADTYGAIEAQNAINAVQGKTVYIDVDYRNAPPGYAVATYATGTNFHSGGLATINDQRGPLYKELVERPNGQLFTVEGRNVTLPLERGTKVYTAAQSKSLIPHYEKGVGVPKNAKVIKTMDWLNKATESTVNVKTDNSGILKKMDKLEKILFGILEKNMIVNVNTRDKSTRELSADFVFEGEINRRGNLQ
ncbi:phage tail tape measure protein [uncultured Vagococcus sp.]|uniref:phage tail tape measure protein n=1 Tax=uncultured Vagococcus sp. TaxID=189676 RepID=UPI0028D5B6AC|nr:phage tail tape measure protein [uncultured Vagococcus sp.]